MLVVLSVCALSCPKKVCVHAMSVRVKALTILMTNCIAVELPVLLLIHKDIEPV